MIKVAVPDRTSLHAFGMQPPLSRMVQIAGKCEELKSETLHMSAITEFRSLLAHELIDFGKLLASVRAFEESSPEKNDLEKQIEFRYPTLMSACKLVNEAEGNGHRTGVLFGGLPLSPYNGWLVHELMKVHGDKHPALCDQDKGILAPKPKQPLNLGNLSLQSEEMQISELGALLEAFADR